jgi:hypothetical protein
VFSLLKILDETDDVGVRLMEPEEREGIVGVLGAAAIVIGIVTLVLDT